MLRICSILVTVPLLFASLVIASRSRTNVTVSGSSSGASMATQLHIAFSKDISGSGVLAGPPYYCAGSLLSAATCMSGPLTSISVPGIEKKIKSFVSAGTVDNTSNIVNDPVYIFSGKFDPIALPSIVKLNEKLYSLLNANIKTNYDLPATHGFPTEHFGGKCAIPNTVNFINNCNFSLAYDVLNHLHGGNLIKPSWSDRTPLVGQMILFYQDAFMNPPASLATAKIDRTVSQWMWANIALYNPSNWGWPTSGLSNWTIPTTTISLKTSAASTRAFSDSFDAQGFAYFPSACAQGQKCPIHVALHGCKQGKHYVGDVFVTKAGYLEVAEANNLIIIFPQVRPSLLRPTNPMGCWDWWGYTTKEFATKLGPQMSGVKKMIDTVRMLNNAIVASASSLIQS